MSEPPLPCPRPRRLPAAPLALVVACGELDPYRGPPADPGLAGPDLVLSPAALDFGTAAAGAEEVERWLEVHNAGDTRLTVTGLDEPRASLQAVPEGTFRVGAPAALVLDPGETRRLPIWFAPGTAGRFEARIDANGGEDALELIGRGAAPVIGLTADPRPTAAYGCTATLGVELLNQGDLPLDIEDIALLGPDPAWSLRGDPSPARLAPGDRTRALLAFSPDWGDAAGGLRAVSLQVASTDPATPVAELRVEAVALEGATVTERFTYQPAQEVDLLFVADTDGVMELYAESLGSQSAPLFELLADAGASAHTAGLTGASACPATTPAWLDGAASPAARAGVLSSALGGPPGPGSEMLLEHALATLALRPACLLGFLRPGAALHLVLIAGDADTSPRAAEGQLAALAEAAPLASSWTVSALLPTDLAACAGTRYGAGYADAAFASGGAIGDLCDPDLDPFLEGVAGASLRGATGGLRVPLDPAPLPESVEVRVDGAIWREWSLDGAELVFPAEGAPPTGADVQVRYMAASPC